MAAFRLNGAALVADPSGALFWPERGLLAVADLHLEKGSAYAARGAPLPPYDTAATLDRLEAALARWRPGTVVCLGDSFHDPDAPARMAPGAAARLRELAAGREWIWIAGNHDPDPEAPAGGRARAEWRLGPLAFRHEARPDAGPGEVSGHYHPKARVRLRGRAASGRCFATDGARLILPAFGAYAGGLDVTEPAIRRLLRRRHEVLFLGPTRVHRFPRRALVPAPPRR